MVVSGLVVRTYCTQEVPPSHKPAVSLDYYTVDSVNRASRSRCSTLARPCYLVSIVARFRVKEAAKGRLRDISHVHR